MTGMRQAAEPFSRAWAEVDLTVVQANARALAAHLAPHRALMAVVKADAYGHGLVPVSRAALLGGAGWLGVATVSEGLALRREGVAAPIALLCSPTPDDAPAVVENGLTLQIGDSEITVALTEARDGRKVEVHLDIDTGMGRSGALPENAVALWQQCRRGGLTVTGLCTHFADADGSGAALTLQQWKRFATVRHALEGAGARFDWIHVSNSAASIQYPDHDCNLVRPGLLLYGLRPPISEPESTGLPAVQAAAILGQGDQASTAFPAGKPALALRTRVAAVRCLPERHTISYGATHRLSRPSRLATILIGYGDGFPRRLSNCGAVLIRGCRAPILGRVCMDQTVVDVTDIPGVAAGDIATCIGTDGAETITAEAIAGLIQTTEHEITTCLTARLPRVYR